MYDIISTIPIDLQKKKKKALVLHLVNQIYRWATIK